MTAADKYNQSLSRRVAVKVVEVGAATLDTLEPLFPEASRPQLQKALENAKRFGLICLATRGQGGRGGAGRDTKRPNKTRAEVNADYRQKRERSVTAGTHFHGLGG